MNAYTMPARPATYMPARPVAYRSSALPQIVPPPTPRFQAMPPRTRTRPALTRQSNTRSVYTRPAMQHATARLPTWPTPTQLPAVPTPIQRPTMAPVGSKKGGFFREDGKLYSVLILFMFWLLLSCTFVGYYVARSL